MSAPRYTEAHVTVNGTTLTLGQSLTVRVALAAFLEEERLDDMGEMGRLYRARGVEVMALMCMADDA